MIEKEIILKLAKDHDSFYLYDENEILKSIERLKNSFKGVDFLYSLKANPNLRILDSIFSQNIGADAASLEEVKLSHEREVSKRDLQYSAPGKSEKDIRESIEIATIIADSFHEIELISKVAQDMKITAKIGIRINPNFTFHSDVGIPSKFGIDEDQIFENLEKIKLTPNVEVTGIHVHSKSQELAEDIIELYHKNVLDLALRFQSALGRKLEFINMGSGIGIPYNQEDSPVEVEKIGRAFHNNLEEIKEKLKPIKIYIETGRYLVGKAGIYVTKVRDKKKSHGKTYIILNNTLNGFYRPSISQMISNYTLEDYPVATEPLFTSFNSSQIGILKSEELREEVTLMGNLCTAADVVAHDVNLPKLEIGDVVIMNNAGSYSHALTPLQFASMEKPKEIFLEKTGKTIETKEKTIKY
ncbi:MAG: diaminopimelate decarboxylase [Tissierellia bacterium]|nr:diaminopimelate decarboxylase [Tissierellia bacterium]